ncbi:hypothetical protein BO70DRAFT_360848 [Aspergillus heteromorphus CBS 117.55]|uniref:Secreted protein n=1 Tax=Aspergillus heteromorphus CBS 117.55 TaxID=1448321 RepID=A0A317WIB4_9EURO|nr:uncharacterized protein BO70DRAFT_360848 [Aspergillus heteromorphus CBS 117.55]PWY86039.1 hypothetical protein BO70DRAFT_360848 [Aspergillus heteromorphus CBS 117.55]
MMVGVVCLLDSAVCVCVTLFLGFAGNRSGSEVRDDGLGWVGWDTTYNCLPACWLASLMHDA